MRWPRDGLDQLPAGADDRPRVVGVRVLDRWRNHSEIATTIPSNAPATSETATLRPPARTMAASAAPANTAGSASRTAGPMGASSAVGSCTAASSTAARSGDSGWRSTMAGSLAPKGGQSDRTASGQLAVNAQVRQVPG